MKCEKCGTDVKYRVIVEVQYYDGNWTDTEHWCLNCVHNNRL